LGPKGVTQHPGRSNGGRSEEAASIYHHGISDAKLRRTPLFVAFLFLSIITGIGQRVNGGMRN
jgi:hypothetical protein